MDCCGYRKIYESQPKSWTLQTKLKDNDAWTTLATVDNSNNDKLPIMNTVGTEFVLNNNNAYKHFRFVMVRRTYNNLTEFQLAEMQYSTDNKVWSTTAPTGTDAGSYTVYYKVVADNNHNDTDAQSLTVTIAMPDGLKSLTLDADTDNWYDINGHKLDGKPTKKGLYIRNGIKVVIK